MRILKKLSYWSQRLLESGYFFVTFKPLNIKTNGNLMAFGNGPSLKETINYIQEHSLRKYFSLAGINDFAKNPVFFSLKPNQYYLIDPAYFTISDHETTNEQIEINKLIIHNFNNCSWHIDLFIPYSQRKSYLPHAINNINISICYLNTVHYPIIINSFIFYSLNISNPRYQNVLNAVLFSGINNNFKTIYLAGADFNLHENLYVDDKNKLFRKNSHFYGQDIIYQPILKTGPGRIHFTLVEYLQAITNMLSTFEVIRDYAIYKNVEIINITENSFIDSFIKKPISEITFNK